ncbi:MAG: hypothetical protein RLZZ367_157 [Bacteroidota bacterium]|jgi:hypothetical protein
MRKLAWLLIVPVVLCFYSACTKDKAPAPTNTTCSGVDSANTYNLRIKSILDAQCAASGCHDGFVASSGIALNNYANSKNSFQTKNCLCSIKQNGGCLPMPQGSDKLADSLITYIQCWTENGYPE